MSRETFDRLRLPLGLGLALMLLAGYMFLRRAEADSLATDPGPSVVVGEPGGGVVSSVQSLEPTASPTAVATASPTPSPTPAPTASPTPAPVAEFSAKVMACRRIDGPECIDRLNRIRPNDETFIALVNFQNAVAGDVLNAILDGPSGQIEGGPYALPGSGRGYYYSTFAVSSLPQGDYTLTALRNGAPVATIELEKVGGDD